jgi:hypothetical protein
MYFWRSEAKRLYLLQNFTKSKQSVLQNRSKAYCTVPFTVCTVVWVYENYYDGLTPLSCIAPDKNRYKSKELNCLLKVLVLGGIM